MEYSEVKNLKLLGADAMVSNANLTIGYLRISETDTSTTISSVLHWLAEILAVEKNGSHGLANVISVSNAGYRLPGYPVIWRNYLLLEYPGSWVEYSVSQILLFLPKKMHMKLVFQHTINFIFNSILIKKLLKS